jgi:hypothetical protein
MVTWDGEVVAITTVGEEVAVTTMVGGTIAIGARKTHPKALKRPPRLAASIQFELRALSGLTVPPMLLSCADEGD